MGKNTELNTHIEYDDFGEYEEVLEGWQGAAPDRTINRRTQKITGMMPGIED